MDWCWSRRMKKRRKSKTKARHLRRAFFSYRIHRRFFRLVRPAFPFHFCFGGIGSQYPFNLFNLGVGRIA